MVSTGHAAPAQETQAAFTVVSQSALYNQATQSVSFQIVFNKTPDFTKVDASGRQANSFQYFIVGDPTQGTYDSIIRGEEIHLSSNLLRIRKVGPEDPDPASGGWGSIVGAVPFTLKGSVLTFSAPLSVLTTHSRDGKFAYQLETYEFGAMTAHLDSQSVAGVSLDKRVPANNTRSEATRHDDDKHGKEHYKEHGRSDHTSKGGHKDRD